MPVYEYRCAACGRRCSLLMGMTSEPDDEVCPHCGARRLERLVSRFVRGRDEEARLDELADRFEQYGEPESPTEMRETLREMGRAMDEDYGDEMEEMFENDPEGQGLDD